MKRVICGECIGCAFSTIYGGVQGLITCSMSKCVNPDGKCASCDNGYCKDPNVIKLDAIVEEWPINPECGCHFVSGWEKQVQAYDAKQFELETEECGHEDESDLHEWLDRPFNR